MPRPVLPSMSIGVGVFPSGMVRIYERPQTPVIVRYYRPPSAIRRLNPELLLLSLDKLGARLYSIGYYMSRLLQWTSI